MSATSRRRRAGVAVLLVGLIAASCGGSDSSGSSSSEAPSASEAPADTAAPGETTGETTGESTAPTDAAPGEPQPGGEIVIGIADPIDGWDPTVAVSVSSYQILKEVLEPLVVLASDGETLQPGLADSWTFDGAVPSLTFTLPAGATFSDGTPVTSADVKFTLDRLLASPYGAAYASITSVDAPDDTTVVLGLGLADTSLLAAMSWANAGILKKDFGGLSEDEYFQAPIGTGPFMIESESPGEEIVLAKNPTYHRGAAMLDKVTYQIVLDPNQRLLQFESGDFDAIDRVPLDLVAQIPDGLAVTSPSSSVSGIIFNQAAAPADDVEFRRAVSLAIDRVSLADTVYDGQATPAEAVLPPFLPGSTPCAECHYLDVDLDAARTALANSSYDGAAIDLMIDTSRAIDALAAQAVQQMLGEVGITVNQVPLDYGAFIERAVTGDYVMLIANYATASPTLNDALGFFLATNSLFSGALPDETLASYGAVAVAADDAALVAAATEYEGIAYEDAWFAPIVNPDNVYGIAAHVHGLPVNPIPFYNLSEIWVSS